MIYELRIYTTKPGYIGEFVKLNSEVAWQLRGNNHGTLVGCWMRPARRWTGRAGSACRKTVARKPPSRSTAGWSTPSLPAIRNSLLPPCGRTWRRCRGWWSGTWRICRRRSLPKAELIFQRVLHALFFGIWRASNAVLECHLR